MPSTPSETFASRSCSEKTASEARTCSGDRGDWTTVTPTASLSSSLASTVMVSTGIVAVDALMRMSSEMRLQLSLPSCPETGRRARAESSRPEKPVDHRGQEGELQDHHEPE